jgi:hypothetical protein
MKYQSLEPAVLSSIFTESLYNSYRYQKANTGYSPLDFSISRIEVNTGIKIINHWLVTIIISANLNSSLKSSISSQVSQ